MKMLKKLLAVVLTGAMALTLLTACGGNAVGNAVTEKDIADAMNDMVKVVNKVANKDVTFTPRAQEREMARKIAALIESETATATVADGEESSDKEFEKAFKNILGYNQGGVNENNFVWFGTAEMDELGTSGQALNFMTQVMDKPANADKLRGKNPADDRYMGTALYKTVDKNGKQVTKRIIVVTATAEEDKDKD